MQKRFSHDKALTFDGWSDNFLKTCEERKLLTDFWKDEAIMKSNDIFEASLIPLNKVWPEIPTREQFRPIVVLSPLLKWIESRFLKKLQEYMLHRLDKH